MADTIKTNLEMHLVGPCGSIIIDDTTERDDLFILSFIPESNATFDILTVVTPDGAEGDATAPIDSGGRNLGSVTAGRLYTAGINSYFKHIQLASGEIACQKFK